MKRRREWLVVILFSLAGLLASLVYEAIGGLLPADCTTPCPLWIELWLYPALAIVPGLLFSLSVLGAGVVSWCFLLDIKSQRPATRQLVGGALVASCAFAAGYFLLWGGQFVLPMSFGGHGSLGKSGIEHRFQVPYLSAEIVLTSFEPRTTLEGMMSELVAVVLVLFVGLAGISLIARGIRLITHNWPSHRNLWCLAVALAFPLLCIGIAGARMYAESASTVLHTHYFGTGVIVLDLVTLAVLDSRAVLPFVGETLLGSLVGYWFIQAMTGNQQRIV